MKIPDTLYTIFRPNSIWIWVLAFILLNLAVRGVGDDNPRSRFMTMRAMGQYHTFATDAYIDRFWSADWSHPPNGHYYSNKAPGPMFIGFPLFYLIDRIKIFYQKVYQQQADVKELMFEKPSPIYGILLSLFLQIIPFSLMVLTLTAWMRKENYPEVSIHFSALAMLFGNTASIFMNTYFGHGMTAFFLLGLIYFYLVRKYFWVGFFYGFALLCDYSVGLLFLPLVLIIILQNRDTSNLNITSPPPSQKTLMAKYKLRTLFSIITGGILPSALWIWYHWSCFGRPWAMANMFQNPSFQDMSQVKGNLWGIFAPLPNLQSLYQLVLGPERGILFTQPWLLLLPFLIFPLLFKKNKSAHLFPLFLFSSLGLLLLLWMNASFGSWHAGSSPGPRYLCMIFPVWGFVAGLSYPHLSSRVKIILWFLLLISILFRSLVYATTILSPAGFALWNWHINFLLHSPFKNWLRFILFWLVLSLFTKLLFTSRLYLRPTPQEE